MKQIETRIEKYYSSTNSYHVSNWLSYVFRGYEKQKLSNAYEKCDKRNKVLLLFINQKPKKEKERKEEYYGYSC